MTVKYLGDNQYQGLAADTKPAAANAAVNAVFQETDTHNQYINTGTAWTLSNKELDIDATGNKLRHAGQPNWIIYKTAIGGTMKAYNTETGVVDFSHATQFDTVLQGCLTAGNYKTIYVTDWLGSNSKYPVSSGFAGFLIGYRTHLIMANNAQIEVPAGWTGNVISLYNTASRVCRDNTIQGGIFYEAGTPQRLWTGYFLYSDRVNTGVDFNNIRGTTINDAGFGIESGLGNVSTWMNGNVIRDITLWNPVIGMDFNDFGVGVNAGINRNLYTHIVQQSATHTTFGARNIRHQGNVFINCNFWDMHLGGGRTATIASTGDGTTIIGGIMGYTGANGISDGGTNTKIIDQWNTKFPYMTARTKAGDPTTTEVPASQYQLWKNSTSGAVKLWYNDAGTMKGVPLT